MQPRLWQYMQVSQIVPPRKREKARQGRERETNSRDSRCVCSSLLTNEYYQKAGALCPDSFPVPSLGNSSVPLWLPSPCTLSLPWEFWFFLSLVLSPPWISCNKSQPSAKERQEISKTPALVACVLVCCTGESPPMQKVSDTWGAKPLAIMRHRKKTKKNKDEQKSTQFHHKPSSPAPQPSPKR
jgi:hypothetical protein